MTIQGQKRNHHLCYSATCLAIMLGALLTACTNAPPADKQARMRELYQGYTESFPEVPDITAAKLAEIQQEVTLVDVRDDEERAVSIIPGALSQAEYEAKKKQPGHNQQVVIYCTIGSRSGFYAQQLIEEGINAFNLRSGILAWTHAQQPLETPAGNPTKQVHVYGAKWDLAAPGYKTTW